MNSPVVVAGVGMLPFTAPGLSASYHVMGGQAARAALRDAGLDYAQVQQAYVGFAHGDSGSGQAALAGVGLTGLPVFNVSNRDASGATALFLANQAVASGAVECALALGFEQALTTPRAVAPERTHPLDRWRQALRRLQAVDPAVSCAAQLFGGAGLAYQQAYGIARDTFARIAVKARRHGHHQPLALLRTALSLEAVLAAPLVCEPLTAPQCSQPASGAAAAVLCTPAFARRHGVSARVVVRAQAMATDRNSTFDEDDICQLAGNDMTRRGARAVYEQSGVDPVELQVVELHDGFTVSELLAYEALGLTAEGTAERFIRDGAHTYGGRVVTNPSGGLLARGHAPGATGLAQCVELTRQLRGSAGASQVAGARLALQHSLGVGAACVVVLYQQQ